MRITIATLASMMVLAAVSVQAAPLPLAKATLVELGTAPPIELVPPRMRLGRASQSLARPLGLLALGSLRPELVTSAARSAGMAWGYRRGVKSRSTAALRNLHHWTPL
jgi:hypothetical protein